MPKHGVPIIIHPLTASPSSFFAARNISHASNAIELPAVENIRFGQETVSMKKRFYVELADMNCLLTTI